ncbi:cyclic nucleotide-binding domain-containing protein [Actinomadura roseirufa]|uniref:cyclic nucleotide-binding domain-containing protein n=1 Tax=Actinomadura roseirufa TaxID=2094049 RepID=UPI0013F15AAE|nr:cyclic nucleotide-binding domain-containing protein [Actinomadura roseirufa]
MVTVQSTTVRATMDALAHETFFRGMGRRHLARLASAAAPVEASAGTRLFAGGAPAERFWLIQDGVVALDLRVPGRGEVTVETLGPGAVLGLSWLFPPHRWRLGAVALHPLRATRFDGRLVRTLCAADPELGYELTSRLGAVMLDRLQAARARPACVGVTAGVPPTFGAPRR